MLLRRGKTYYCRVWVPLDLREQLGRKELKKSLGTKKRQEAKTAASALECKAETAFFRMRSCMLTNREIEQLTVSILAEFSGRTEEHRRQRGDAFSFMDAGVSFGLNVNRDFSALETIEASFNFPRDPETAVAFYIANIKALEKQRATGVYSDELRWSTARQIKEKGLDVDLPPRDWFDENSDSWFDPPPAPFAQVCDAVIDGLIGGYALEMERVQGRRDAEREAALAARIEATKPKPKLSELWEAYKGFKVAKGTMAAKAQAKNEATLKEVVRIIADRELADYKRADVVRLIAELNKKNSASTITGKVEFISSMFRFALETPDSSDEWKVRGNPFSKMQVKENGEKKRRVPYEYNDLVNLLCGLLSEHKLVEPHRFWVPLVALYTGARQNDICQLRVADIVPDDGILVFRFKHNPALQQTTKSRKDRTCPVHPMLRKLGFLEYLEKQHENGHDRAFPTLTHTAGKNWCGKVRNWWNETFQEKWVDDTTGKSFHSLRKNFTNWFKQGKKYDKASDRAVIQSMIGHDDDDMTGEHYEEDFPPKTQYRMLVKLDYGFDDKLIEALQKKEY